MLVAYCVDSQALNQAISQWRSTQPNGLKLTFEEIAELTKRLPPPYGSVSDRTFRNARNGERIRYANIASLAKLFEVEPHELIRKEDLPAVAAPGLVSAGLATLDARAVERIVEVSCMALVSASGLPKGEILAVLAGDEEAQQRLEERLTLPNSTHPEQLRRFGRNRVEIARRAAPYMGGRLPEELPAQDWADVHSLCAQPASDPEIQEFWSQILALEAHAPGSVSRKTLRTIQDLTPRQARLFEAHCGAVFRVGDSLLSIRPERATSEYLQYFGLTFDDLLELDDYGLVTLGARAYRAPLGTWLTYFDKRFQATEVIDFRANPLTTAGKEIYPIARGTKSEAYLAAVRKSLGGRVGPIEVAAD